MEAADLKTIKSFVKTLFVLAAICAFILLVDKYLAGTFMWWIVVILTCAGYLYMRVHRDLNWRPAALRHKQTPQYNGTVNTLTNPETGRSFALRNVTKIEIETTGNGPFDEDLYWIFSLRSSLSVRMPGGVAQGLGVVGVLEGFEGVDFENVILAASTTEPALFLIWEKNDNE